MKNAIRIILTVGLFAGFVFAQQGKVQFADIVKAFNAFEYKQVVGKSGLLLKQEEKPGPKQLVELLRMKAIAHYVLNQEDMAVLTVVEILKINPRYQLDPLQNSPKLVAFFNKVKENYTPPAPEKKPVKKSIPQKDIPDLRHIKGSVLRSLALPGWGHLYNGQKGKGAFFMSASVLSLSSAAYLIIKTKDLEQKYLNETMQAEIDKSYKTYNRIYNMRNGVMALYALVWIYAQFDLSSTLFSNAQQSLSIHPTTVHSKNFAPGIGIKAVF